MGRSERLLACPAGLGSTLHGIFSCDKTSCKVLLTGMDSSGGGIGLGPSGVLDSLEFLFECGGDKTFESFLFLGGFSGLEHFGDSLPFCLGGGKLGTLSILASEFLKSNPPGKGAYKFSSLDDEFRDPSNTLPLSLFVELASLLPLSRFSSLLDGKDTLVFFVSHDISS